jgi:hypothetical protein
MIRNRNQLWGQLSKKAGAMFLAKYASDELNCSKAIDRLIEKESKFMLDEF